MGTEQEDLAEIGEAGVLEEQEELADALIAERIVCEDEERERKRVLLRSRTRRSGKMKALEALSDPKWSWLVRYVIWLGPRLFPCRRSSRSCRCGLSMNTSTRRVKPSFPMPATACEGRERRRNRSGRCIGSSAACPSIAPAPPETPAPACSRGIRLRAQSPRHPTQFVRVCFFEAP